MTLRDAAKMRRLELENEKLRADLDWHMQIYRDQLYRIAELETQIQMVKEAIEQ
jgi:hypothetical protein